MSNISIQQAAAVENEEANPAGEEANEEKKIGIDTADSIPSFTAAQVSMVNAQFCCVAHYRYQNEPSSSSSTPNPKIEYQDTFVFLLQSNTK
jgi:hypothetical protein